MASEERPKSSKASLVFAWAMFAGVVVCAAWLVLGPLVRSARPTPADLARGEALIRSQYSSNQTSVGRVSLTRAGNCAMKGSAELVDAGAGGTTRQVDCVVTISGKDHFAAACR